MVSQKQYERVLSYIRKGIEEGAELLVGGEGRPEGLESGFFVKPTVFVNVNNDMTIAREEIFGPVLSVITYENDEDAIRIANDTEYGLHAFVSGTDVQRARRVASQLQAGRVAINGMLDDQRRRSADLSTPVLAGNSARTGSKRFSNRGQFSNNRSCRPE
jgi:aldehyde dehydrogenase (NAD+)